MQRNSIHSWVVVLTSALFFLFAFVNMNIFDALNHQIRLDLHLSAVELSTLAASYFYANVIFLIPAGLLLDRVSARKLLLSTMLIMIASVLGLALAHSYYIALLCRFITGATASFCLLGSVLLAARWFTTDKAGTAIGMVVTIAMIGGMISQGAGFVADLAGGWRHAFFIMAAGGLVLWAIIWLVVKDAPQDYTDKLSQQRQKHSTLGFWRSFGQSLRNPQNWLAGIYTNILSIPVVVIGGLWSIDYLLATHHVSHAQAATISSMIFLGMIVGSPFYGWLSDTIKRRKQPMIMGVILLLVTVIIIMSNPSFGFATLMVLFFLMGFFAGAQVLTYAFVVEANPRHITGTSESLTSTLIMASGAIFQPLYAYLLQSYSNRQDAVTYSAQAYHYAMMMLPIAFVVALVLSLFLRETGCQNLYSEKPEA